MRLASIQALVSELQENLDLIEHLERAAQLAQPQGAVRDEDPDWNPDGDQEEGGRPTRRQRREGAGRAMQALIQHEQGGAEDMDLDEADEEPEPDAARSRRDGREAGSAL